MGDDPGVRRRGIALGGPTLVAVGEGAGAFEAAAVGARVGERGARHVAGREDGERGLIQVARFKQPLVLHIARPGAGEAVGLQLHEDAESFPAGQPGLHGVAKLMG